MKNYKCDQLISKILLMRFIKTATNFNKKVPDCCAKSTIIFEEKKHFEN